MRSIVIGLCFAAAALAGGCRSREPAAEPERREPAPAAPSPAAAGVEERDERPVIVALGDSLTAGLGVDPAASYPAALERRIEAAGYRYRVVNAGVSGDTSAQGLNRLAAVRALRPAIVIVALGANDGLRGLPVASTRRNLEAIVAALQADGARVVLAGMEMPPNYGPAYTAQFRTMFRELAREQELPFVPFLLDGVGGMRELNQDDGIHPTAEGYRIVADNVWRVLGPLLTSRGSG